MVELTFEHAIAELAVWAAEEQVLVPHDVDDFRRRDTNGLGDAQVDELLVFVDGVTGESRCPPMLARHLARERLRRRIHSAEHRRHAIGHVRRNEVLEVVVAQSKPKVLLRGGHVLSVAEKSGLRGAEGRAAR